MKFVLPAADCLLLPIVHSTAEELAEYIALEVAQQLGAQLRSRHCQWLEVSVSERPGQTGPSALGGWMMDGSMEVNGDLNLVGGLEHEIYFSIYGGKIMLIDCHIF